MYSPYAMPTCIMMQKMRSTCVEWFTIVLVTRHWLLLLLHPLNGFFPGQPG